MTSKVRYRWTASATSLLLESRGSREGLRDTNAESKNRNTKKGEKKKAGNCGCRILFFERSHGVFNTRIVSRWGITFLIKAIRGGLSYTIKWNLPTKTLLGKSLFKHGIKYNLPWKPVEEKLLLNTDPALLRNRNGIAVISSASVIFPVHYKVIQYSKIVLKLSWNNIFGFQGVNILFINSLL